MARHPKELDVPPAAWSSRSSLEVLRTWIVDSGVQVSLQKSFEDPRAWGILLVDLARHASRIYAMEKVCTEAEALKAIKVMFDAEWDRPTDLGTTRGQH